MSVATRERPILFSAPMVRAILGDKKTQTRRVVTPQPGSGVVPYSAPTGNWNWVLAETGHGTRDPFPCPYGAPGDRLWVRETWRAGMELDDDKPYDFPHLADVRYEADGLAGFFREDGARYFTATEENGGFGRLRPSIFMPRWASRLTLEVENVRVERLRDITMADVFAEGLGLSTDKDNPEDFAVAWDSINSKRAPWDSNPWVWVVTFKRVT